jgi:GTP pyrophosphokinase
MRVFGRWRDWAAAERDLRRRLPAGSVEALGETYRFAEVRHGDQVRPAGEPYTWHLLEVLEIGSTVGGLDDLDSLRACLLHDVVEDTPTTEAEVRDAFGAGTAGLVRWMTKPEPVAPTESRTALRADYLRSFVDAPERARIIKLSDRYSNVQRLDTHPRPAKQRSYYAETVEHFMPLALATPAFAELYRDWQRRFGHLA